jgi:hypothetical protein
MALAMIHAKTVEPEKYNASIMEVTKPDPGKTVVNTFADGKKALEAGEQIQYVGAFGPIAFTETHNFTGGFVVTQAKGKKEAKVAEVTSEQIASAVSG